MTRCPTRVLFFAIIVAVGSTSLTARRPQDPVRTAIDAVNQAYASAFGRGDAAGVAACYTTNGQLLPPNADIVQGRENVQAFWKGAIDSGVAELTLTTLELEHHGDTAHTVASYAMRGKDGNEVDRGKSVVIWKQEGGQWKVHRDIWNTSLPAGSR